MLGYYFEIIYKRENKILWQMYSQRKRKTNGFYVLFPFYNMTRWKKRG